MTVRRDQLVLNFGMSNQRAKRVKWFRNGAELTAL